MDSEGEPHPYQHYRSAPPKLIVKKASICERVRAPLRTSSQHGDMTNFTEPQAPALHHVSLNSCAS
jgi:hypothetical protein